MTFELLLHRRGVRCAFRGVSGSFHFNGQSISRKRSETDRQTPTERKRREKRRLFNLHGGLLIKRKKRYMPEGVGWFQKQFYEGSWKFTCRRPDPRTRKRRRERKEEFPPTSHPSFSVVLTTLWEKSGAKTPCATKTV